MTASEALDLLRPEIEPLGGQLAEEHGALCITCPDDRVPQVLRKLRDGPLAFDYLSFVTAEDYPPHTEEPAEGEGGAPREVPGRIELVYHLFSLEHRVQCFVRTALAREAPRIATVSDIYPGAAWHERETYDLFGVVFVGHPDLRRILLPDYWVGHPLRKDYDPSQTPLVYTPEKRWPEVADKR